MVGWECRLGLGDSTLTYLPTSPSPVRHLLEPALSETGRAPIFSRRKLLPLHPHPQRISSSNTSAAQTLVSMSIWLSYSFGHQNIPGAFPQPPLDRPLSIVAVAAIYNTGSSICHKLHQQLPATVTEPHSPYRPITHVPAAPTALSPPFPPPAKWARGQQNFDVSWCCSGWHGGLALCSLSHAQHASVAIVTTALPAYALNVHVSQAVFLPAAFAQVLSLETLHSPRVLRDPDSFPVAILSAGAVIATRAFLACEIYIRDIITSLALPSTTPPSDPGALPPLCCHQLHHRGLGHYHLTLTVLSATLAAKRATTTIGITIALCATWLNLENNPLAKLHVWMCDYIYHTT